jgi:short-subunit dehydrogenase
MSIPDDEFDVLSEEELALLSRRFDRLHENQRNARRSSGKHATSMASVDTSSPNARKRRITSTR